MLDTATSRAKTKIDHPRPSASKVPNKQSRPARRAAFAFEAYTSPHGRGVPVKNIYVGNLGFQTSEEELRDLFGKHGRVERVSILYDSATGKPRGFAFVEMPDDVEAERAIRALNGVTLGGRTLKVNEARPRPGRADPRGNSERRFGRG